MRALAARKERDRTGRFVVEGIRAVAEALQSSIEVERLVIAPELLESAFAHDVVERAVRRGVSVVEVSAGVFGTLSRKDGPQGIALVGRQEWVDLSEVRLGLEETWVALDAPQDPGNIGTIVRTCDATGVGGVVLIGATADPYDPVALRASTGAVFTVRLARASWDAFATWVRREGASLVGAAGGAPTTYRDAVYSRRTVLLMGSEREGLRPEQQAVCESLVSLPMVGRVDSLNLAVATGVILYEMLARRG